MSYDATDARVVLLLRQLQACSKLQWPPRLLQAPLQALADVATSIRASQSQEAILNVCGCSDTISEAGLMPWSQSLLESMPDMPAKVLFADGSRDEVIRAVACFSEAALKAWPTDKEVYETSVALMERVIIQEDQENRLGENMANTNALNKQRLQLFRRMSGYWLHIEQVRQKSPLTVQVAEDAAVLALVQKLATYLKWARSPDFKRELLPEAQAERFEKEVVKGNDAVTEFRTLYLQTALAPAKQKRDDLKKMYLCGPEGNKWDASLGLDVAWMELVQATDGTLRSLNRDGLIKLIASSDAALPGKAVVGLRVGHHRPNIFVLFSSLLM